jgi:hypothetical protein
LSTNGRATVFIARGVIGVSLDVQEGPDSLVLQAMNSNQVAPIDTKTHQNVNLRRTGTRPARSVDSDKSMRNYCSRLSLMLNQPPSTGGGLAPPCGGGGLCIASCGTYHAAPVSTAT